jgi:hypothetical protein
MTTFIGYSKSLKKDQTANSVVKKQQQVRGEPEHHRPDHKEIQR